MKVELYLIGDCSQYGVWGATEKVQVEKFEFDSEDEEDKDLLEKLIDEQPEKLDEETRFLNACHNYIQESENDWEQRGCPSIILNKEQLEKIILLLPTLENSISY